MIHLKNVTKRYGDVVALQRVNLEIHSGEYVTILGPTGSGKTTTLRLIAGLTQPDSGDILFDKASILKKPPEERDIGYVFQNFVLFPHLNTWHNIAFGGEAKGWSEERVFSETEKTLELVRLRERSDAYPNELSGGMQQRVALARALASGAKILLLDEPIGALDARLRMSLRYELRRLVKELGLTAIHVTHDQEEAMAISDRIVVMRKGRLIEHSSPEELYRDPKNIFTANFVGEANFLISELAENEGTGEIRLQNSRIRTTRQLRGRKGDKVVVAIRPEHLNLAEERHHLADQLQGVIVNIVFMGSFLRYEIQPTDGQILKCDVLQTGAKKPLEIGANVFMSAEPENVLVYPYPPDGLENEIALE